MLSNNNTQFTRKYMISYSKTKATDFRKIRAKKITQLDLRKQRRENRKKNINFGLKLSYYKIPI